MERQASGRRKSARLTVLLDPPGGRRGGHSAGLNALLWAPAGDGADGGALYTASRDSTVRCWEAGGRRAGGELRCTAALVGHADWVTSLAALGAPDQPGSLVLSGGCDGQLCLWAAPGEAAPAPGAAVPQPRPLARLQPHGDYITQVAASPAAAVAASCGLGGELRLWDCGAARACARGGARPPPAAAPPAGGAAHSIYALALSAGSQPGSPQLATGDASGLVALWDTRGHFDAPAMRLRGHAGVVRALLLDGPLQRLASAGAGGQLLLWDLRSAKPLARAPGHGTAGVRALAAADGLSGRLWSGDADGRVMCTDAGAAFRAPPPPAGVSLTGDCGMDLDLAEREEGEEEEEAEAEAAPPLEPGASRLLLGAEAAVTALALAGPRLWVGTTAPLARAYAAEAGSPGPPAQQAATAAVPGGGMRRAQLLPDRRSVLTAAADGRVTLWDLVAAAPAPAAAQPAGDARAPDARGWAAAVEAATAALRARAAAGPPAAASLLSMLPHWCSVDARHGCLGVHLEAGSAVSAIALRSELFPDAAAEEAEEVLNLGEQLVKSVLRGLVVPIEAEGEGDDDEPGSRGSGASLQLVPPAPPAFPWPVPAPALLFASGEEEGRLRAEAESDLGGARSVAHLLPGWAHDLALYASAELAGAAKSPCLLAPAPGGVEEAGAAGRCSVFRTARVSDAADYVATQLRAPAAAGEAPRRPVLACRGERLREDETLAAVHARLWAGQAGDLLLHYAWE